MLGRRAAAARSRRGRRRLRRRRRGARSGASLQPAGPGEEEHLTLGVWGRTTRSRPTRASSTPLQRLQRRGGDDQDQEVLPDPRGPDGGARAVASAPTSLPDRPRRPLRPGDQRPQPADRRPARRPRRRLRRRLLPAGARGLLQDRQLSACPTASRRWSCTTTRRSSTSRPWPTRGSTCRPSTTRTSPRSRTWTFAATRQAAADEASRPRRGIAGFYIPPTMRGLAPVHLLGRRVGLQRRRHADLASAFSSDDTKSALEQVLPVLGDPKLTLSTEQLWPRNAPGVVPGGKLA